MWIKVENIIMDISLAIGHITSNISGVFKHIFHWIQLTTHNNENFSDFTQQKNAFLLKLIHPLWNSMRVNNMISHEMIKSIAIMLVKSIIVIYKLIDVAYFQFSVWIICRLKSNDEMLNSFLFLFHAQFHSIPIEIDISKNI